jgi:hypothetical protein
MAVVLMNNSNKLPVAGSCRIRSAHSKTAISFQIVTELSNTKTKLNSVAFSPKRTIPTERPPLVGEVSANFCA